MTIRRKTQFPHLAVACVSALLAFGAVANTTQTYKLDIAAQPIDDALHEFGRQSGLQIFLASEEGKGITTPRIVGTFTVQDALARMLSNTGLHYEYLDERTIAIRAAKSRAGADATQVAQDLKLARASADPAASLQETQPPVDEKKSGRQSGTSDESVKGVPEILVKGARSVNVDIRRTEDDPQPYVVFSGEEIIRSNAPNLEEFFKNRLPMNSVARLPSQIVANDTSFASSVNLRGLGSGQTLILVDGRRLPGISNGNVTQPEIKGIALSSIERIEILPSTAGGIYGGGATGGVINIITRGDYSGLDARATYGNTFDSDVTERRIDLSGGFNLGERTHVRFSGAYSDANKLVTGDRDLAQRGRNLLNGNIPFDTATNPPLGYTTNICATATATSTTCANTPLVLDNGTVLTSNHTFIPVGYARTDGGAALASNAGRYNIDIPDDLNGRQMNLLSNPTVKSAALNLRHEFNDRFEAFIDVTRFQNSSVRPFTAIMTNSVTLAASAANNPFNTPIRVTFPTPGLTNTYKSEQSVTRATGGLIVHLPGNWMAEADYAWSRSTWEAFYGNNVLTSAGDAAYVSGLLDVMRDLNTYRLDYSPYLLPELNSGAGPGPLVQKDSTIRASGPIFKLPGGAVTLSTMAERREEVMDTVFTSSMSAAGTSTYGWFPKRSQTTDSYYLEARVPLFSGANALPFVKALDFQASVRRDEYATTSPSPVLAIVTSRDGPFPPLSSVTKEVQANRYTLALSYSPFTDVTMRASLGTGFLPPAMTQIAPSTPTVVSAASAAALLDPKRGGGTGSVPGYTSSGGGSLNIQPEDSKSWSAGFVLTPHVIPGLRLSVDLTHIKKTNEILTIQGQQVIDLEAFYPGRVTRGPLTTADIALGYTGGPITALDVSAINVAATNLQAIDFQADYTFDTTRFGQFHFYALGTKTQYLKRRNTPLASEDDLVSFTNGPLAWRGNLGLTWNKNAWTVDWNAQYFDKYRVYAVTANAAARLLAAQQQGSDFVESQMYHDLMLSYRLGSMPVLRQLLSDTEVSLSIQNVFDKSPPIMAAVAPNGGYSMFGDPRLRRYSISVNKQF